jgi:hypothetical protein
MDTYIDLVTNDLQVPNCLQAELAGSESFPKLGRDIRMM